MVGQSTRRSTLRRFIRSRACTTSFLSSTASSRRREPAGLFRQATRCSGGSAIAKPVRSAFPLRDIVGDHARRFHGGLAELGIAGNLALHALTFGVEQVPQAFEFGNQVFDFRDRSSSDALDQRVDVVDGDLGARLKDRFGAARQVRSWSAQIGCYSAWGPDADRLAKPLIHRAVKGSVLSLGRLFTTKGVCLSRTPSTLSK